MLKIFLKDKRSSLFRRRANIEENKYYDTDTWDTPPQKVDPETVPDVVKLFTPVIYKCSE
jgi:hypothetical protein